MGMRLVSTFPNTQYARSNTMKSNNRTVVSRRRLLKSGVAGASALALSQVLAGCAVPPPRAAAPAGEAAAPASGAPAAEGPIALRVCVTGTQQRADTFKKISEAFEAANANTKIEWIPIQAAEWDEYFGKLVTLIAAGENIDSSEIATEGMQLIASKNVLRPLDEFVQGDEEAMKNFFSDVAPQLVEVQMYKGSLYVLPTLWGAATIYYNKALFDQAGVAYPKDDWTTDDFLASAQKIRALGDDIYGFGFPNRHWGGLVPWMYINDGGLYEFGRYEGGDWLWSKFYAGVESAQGRAGGINWGAVTANNPANVEALQFQSDLIWKHKVSPSPTNLNELAAFMSGGKLGMMPGHRAHTGVLIGAGMKKGDFDVVQMPKWKTQRHQFGSSGLSIMKTGKNPDAVWKFIKFQTSPEQMARYVDKAVHTSSRRSVTNDPKQHEMTGPDNWQVFYNTLDKNPLSTAIPAPVETKDMTGIFTKYVGLSLANEMPAPDALANMQKELEELAKRVRPK
jgi:ABC-type glycerol-3-phosphate transport system substrate-binding protein